MNSSKKRCRGLQPLHIFSIPECYIEIDIGYPGNDLNSGVDNIQPDVEACRLSCSSIAGSQFFDWVRQDYHDSYYHESCWCKSSDAGRTARVGVTTGNVNCRDVTGRVKWKSKFFCTMILFILTIMVYYTIAYPCHLHVEAESTWETMTPAQNADKSYMNKKEMSSMDLWRFISSTVWIWIITWLLWLDESDNDHETETCLIIICFTIQLATWWEWKLPYICKLPYNYLRIISQTGWDYRALSREVTFPKKSLFPGNSLLPGSHFFWKVTSREVMKSLFPWSQEITFSGKSLFPRSHFSQELLFPGSHFSREVPGSHFYREKWLHMPCHNSILYLIFSPFLTKSGYLTCVAPEVAIGKNQI